MAANGVTPYIHVCINKQASKQKKERGTKGEEERARKGLGH